MESSLLGIKAMRLSLRTLLAFEDNIFDQEQHRQLERLIPGHDAAAITLDRIRKVVRDPALGSPGLVGEREELDPNIVAEYLDHQMAADILERFETFCLSSDKYLAEAASIHQVLSNVLGEPARTSRECRIRCYDLYGTPTTIPVSGEKARFFAENEASRSAAPPGTKEAKSQSFDTFLRLFPAPSDHVAPDRTARDCTAGERIVAEPVEMERETPPPISYPVGPVEEKSSPWSVFFRFFSSQNDRNAEETNRESASNAGERRPSRGFPLWMLLLLFFLGLFLGWWSWNDGPWKSGETSRVAVNDFKRPTWKNEKAENTPEPPQTISAAVAAPSKEENRPTGPPENMLSERRSENDEKKFPPRSVAVVPPPVPMPKKEETPKIVAEKTAERMTEDAEKKSPPVSVAVTPPPVPPPAPTPKKEELPKIVAEKPRGAAEEKSLPAPTLPAIATPAPKVEAPVEAPVENAAVVNAEPKKVTTERPERPTIAELPVASGPVPTNGGASKTVDPFLSAATQETNRPEAEPPVSWNAADNAKTVPPAVSQAVKAEWPAPMPQAAPQPRPQQPLETAKRHDGKSTPGNEPMPFATSTPNILETSQTAGPVPIRTTISPTTPTTTPGAIPKQEPDLAEQESLIVFQPITAPSQRRGLEIDKSREKKEPPRRNDAPESRENVQASWNHSPSLVPPRKILRYESLPASEQPSASFGKVVHPVATARQFGEITTVGEIRENSPGVVGRVLPQPEPGVIFSAPSAGEQWTWKAAPLELHPDQYLLTVTPYRADLDLDGVFRIEMIGDTKLCLLAPDENGMPGIFVDYGRIVIRPNPSGGGESVRSLRIRTEHAEGTLRITGPESSAFIDTFAEVLPENGAPSKTPKTSPIIALLPAEGQSIAWHPSDSPEPLTTHQQASVPLKAGSTGFGAIRGLPNWLQRTPLPVEGRQLAEICSRIFQEHTGNSEAALHAMILQDNLSVRFFGYRLWGDLGRFDVPLSLLAETKPEEEPVRQGLVPYFREVMKRDEETIQRFADAIETVRR